MPDFAYYLSHERERDRNRTSTSPPPLPRRTSFKRRLFSSDSDDGHDDYPYSGAHRPSRALTQRDAPSQLERWNIWTDSRKEARNHERCDSGAEDETERRRRRKVSFSLPDELNENEERDFRLRIASLRETRLSPQPRRYHAESDDERVRPSVWPGELFRRRERCVSEDYEARERARSRSRERRRRERFWCDDDGDEEVVEREFEGERMVRIRRVKRTRTEEWRPLAGFRRG